MEGNLVRSRRGPGYPLRRIGVLPQYRRGLSSPLRRGGTRQRAGVVYHPKRWRRVTQVTSNFRARCQSVLDKRKMCAIYVIDPPSWAIPTNGAQFSIFVKNKPTNRI